MAPAPCEGTYVDSTVAAIPMYFGTMGAEYLWLRGTPAERGPTPADYERRDTITSLAMGVGSLLAPMVVPKLFGPITPGKGKYGKALVVTAVAAAAAHHGRRPGRAPGVDRSRRAPDANDAGGAAARAARRVARVGGVVAVVDGRASRSPRRWASRTTRGPDVEPPARPRPRPRAGRARRCGPRLGLHLLLEPPVHAREPVHVGDPRRAPLERALQPLDRAAPARRRRGRHLRAVQPARAARHAARAHRAGPRHQPALPVLDPHRHDPPARTVRRGPQHAVAPPGAPRQQPQYIDRNHGSILITWDRLFGTFETGSRTGRVRPDEESRHVQSRLASPRTSTSRCCATSADRESWRERLSFVFRGPGWAYRRHAEQAVA